MAMVHEESIALREGRRSYPDLREARPAARAMTRDQRVSRDAIAEDRLPLQFIEWVGR